ncbi:unnamed protein product [Symbiodinium sp. CCMP2592]|nr:unnamed protein product [Symbiodinium sp. CCMP2592]
MSDAARSSADADKTDENTPAAATATMDELGDLVLDFGVDSMPACSVFLRAASPVFNRMLQSGMQEAKQGVIKVEVAKKEEFANFYSLLWPGEWSRDRVRGENVDALLAIADYYEVGFVKHACEDQLLTLPVTGQRLLQAHQTGLHRQYVRCIDSLASSDCKEDLVMIGKEAPELLLDVALKMQARFGRLFGLQQDVARSREVIANTPFGTEGLSAYETLIRGVKCTKELATDWSACITEQPRILRVLDAVETALK